MAPQVLLTASATALLALLSLKNYKAGQSQRRATDERAPSSQVPDNTPVSAPVPASVTWTREMKLERLLLDMHQNRVNKECLSFYKDKIARAGNDLQITLEVEDRRRPVSRRSLWGFKNFLRLRKLWKLLVKQAKSEVSSTAHLEKQMLG